MKTNLNEVSLHLKLDGSKLPTSSAADVMQASSQWRKGEQQGNVVATAAQRVVALKHPRNGGLNACTFQQLRDYKTRFYCIP